MTEEMQERARQYLAGRAELFAGDRMVIQSEPPSLALSCPRQHDLPLLVAGAGAALALARGGRAT
jgi:hypothetical protein